MTEVLPSGSPSLFTSLNVSTTEGGQCNDIPRSSSSLSPVNGTEETSLGDDGAIPTETQSNHSPNLETEQQLQQLKCQNEKLQSDLDRLRKHLISVEESYTEELITAEDREKELRNRLAFCENHISVLEKQIKDDGLVRDLKNQLENMRSERDSALTQSSHLDDQVQQLSTTNQRLQLLLEQTTRGL